MWFSRYDALSADGALRKLAYASVTYAESILCRRSSEEHEVFRARSRNAKHFDRRHKSGDGEIRTLDPLLARQVLSQLSYTPINSGTRLLSHTVTSVVPSAAWVLTVVFGMGTGVTPRRIGTGN